MSNWPLVPLGEVANFDRKGVSPEAIRSGTRYVGLENITVGGDLVQVESVEKGELASSKFLFTRGHILYGKLRPYLRKIARPAFDGICSTDIVPLLAGPRVDRDYLTHYLRLDSSVAFASDRAVGVNLPRISPSILATLTVPLPPLQQQRRIAAILDQAEALRAKRRQALAKLDALGNSIFESSFGSSEADLSRYPVRQVDEICSLIVDCVNRTAPLSLEATHFKMIRTSNVKAGKVDLSSVRYVSEETFKRWNRRAAPIHDDVLLTREAPVGEVGVLKGTDRVFLGQRLMLYRAEKTRILPSYLSRCMQSTFVQDQLRMGSSGSTVKHLPLPICRSFKLRVPPISMQTRFAKAVDKHEKVKADQELQLERLEVLFSSLQQRAFRGEL